MGIRSQKPHIKLVNDMSPDTDSFTTRLHVRTDMFYERKDTQSMSPYYENLVKPKTMSIYLDGLIVVLVALIFFFT